MRLVIDSKSTTRVNSRPPTVLGHRGASGYRPEHTLASYELAIRQCADLIEPDVVSTADGVLVVRHENEISGTTDVASRPEFAVRRTTKVVDGVGLTGWFTEDFTLAELRTLRAKERLPQLRPANTAYDGKYQIPTLAEVFDLARRSRTCSGQPVGVAPETKHPSYFAGLGLPLEQRLVAELEAAGLNRPLSRVVIQSFEVGNLQRLNEITDVRLVQLIDCGGAPWDLRAAGDRRSYADLVTSEGLHAIAAYADQIGVCKDVMIPRNAAGFLTESTDVIENAHNAGLEVVGWTFRRENNFLPADFRVGTDPAGIGDLPGEINTFLDAGMDSFFTDNPDVGDQVVSSR
jgi:glycerophosphoryl diester phosphodiesterase